MTKRTIPFETKNMTKRTVPFVITNSSDAPYDGQKTGPPEGGPVYIADRYFARGCEALSQYQKGLV